MKINLTDRDRKDFGVIGSTAAFKALSSTYYFLLPFCIKVEDLQSLKLTKASIQKYYLILTPRIEKRELLLIEVHNGGFNIGLNNITYCTKKESSVQKTSVRNNSAVLKFSPSYTYIFKGIDIPTIERQTRGMAITHDLNLEEEDYYYYWFIIEKKLCDRLLKG